MLRVEQGGDRDVGDVVARDRADPAVAGGAAITPSAEAKNGTYSSRLLRRNV